MDEGIYRKILQDTVDVFGDDNMTETVMVKTIEAASYIAWRDIMGPKHNENGRTITKKDFEDNPFVI